MASAPLCVKHGAEYPRRCGAAVRIEHGWLGLCRACARRAVPWYERKYGAPTLALHDPAAVAAFDSAIARRISFDDAATLARNVDDSMREATRRRILTEWAAIDPDSY